MCAVCGLPITHSNMPQILGWVTLFSFTLTTFLGAWWVVTSLNIGNRLKSFRKNKDNENRNSMSVAKSENNRPHQGY